MLGQAQQMIGVADLIQCLRFFLIQYEFWVFMKKIKHNFSKDKILLKYTKQKQHNFL